MASSFCLSQVKNWPNKGIRHFSRYGKTISCWFLKGSSYGLESSGDKKATPLLEGIPEGSAFYFVHSYYVEPSDSNIVVTYTDYGLKFPSIVGRDKVYGIQFHPEKSSTLGLRILENFGKLVTV
ncbi:hypothetical protein N752_07415 [Desulforamulus aquiferis]|nr:hypothetical protein N752_07415 [Desulforamulus aquiferis]